MSRIRPPDCSKLAKSPKNDNEVTTFRHDVSVKFFWRCFVFLVNFNYWSKFHVNIITGSGIITISVYKGLTRNPEIGNTLVWVLPNIWRLGQVMDAKFGTNVSNRCYWMLQNSRVTACIVFVLLRENQLGGGEKITHPTQIRVNPTSIHGFMFFVSILEIWRKFSFWVNSEWWISWLIYIR